MRSPPIPLNVAGLATAPRLIRPDSVCALYVQIRWEENTKVNCVLSNAADQNRQNILLAAIAGSIVIVSWVGLALLGLSELRL